ncbi:hypothetical protein RS130_21395 [Paraglaciecola aquimarina]|uniref:Type I phosphodiesterase/nucleotide pyrophosphatase n=1 Tax=Paraglaciecola aquimarina TaxID=1235557 RepID=A0ABU3T1F3_9ALTE|nr:hypothetical protein [Paraglaciecola aquimarina]MDU0356104.1 hypothetical protein [Paraglaciecola aquimarina]
MAKKNLLLIELNEINFEFVEKYIKLAKLPNFQKLLESGVCRTSSENKYEELEPWIQWVSAHTGLDYSSHKIFRLGDIVYSSIPQIFEKVEMKGYAVGAISPMNASNNLKKPCYFVPDPWTKTHSDGSFWSRKLTKAIQQTVNDNAQSKVSVDSICILVLALLRFARVKNYSLYFKLIISSLSKKWSKAMVLDLLLHDIHMSFLRKYKTNFSTVFLNAGAHIQHHYMFNSKVYEVIDKAEAIKNPSWYVGKEKDPLLDLLNLYDRIIGEYLALDYDIVLATGLTQIPFTSEKYYWRIKDHEHFLSTLNINYSKVFPRMTRDFLIEFASNEDASSAKAYLSKLISLSDGIKIFNEIDNRGKSLFVTLTYPKEIKGTFLVGDGVSDYEISDQLAFVAVKNGMHFSEGFLYTRGVQLDSFESGDHVKKLYNIIDGYFN